MGRIKNEFFTKIRAKIEKMLKNICITVFLLAMLVFLQPANAFDLRIQPRFKTGVEYYSYEQDAVEFSPRDSQGIFPNTQSRIEYSDWLPFVSGGGTIFADRFFVDFDVQYAFEGHAESDFKSQSFVGGGGELPNDAVFHNNGKLNAKFYRLAWAVSAGFEVVDNLILFGGYKYAKTSFTSAVHGDLTTFQASNQLNIPFLTGTTMGDAGIIFEYEGPFVGMNYNWRIHQGFMNGALSFNFAVAFLDSYTELDLSKLAVKSDSGGITSLDFQDGGNRGLQFFSLDGDTTGYSFGVGWQGITSVKNLTYLMGVTGYRYEFKGDETIENRVRLNFGLSYGFDF